MNAYIKQYSLLSDIESGKEVKIARLNGGDKFKAKMISLGLVPDTTVTVIKCDGCQGPMAVKVNHTRLVIGRGMAKKISVIKE